MIGWDALECLAQPAGQHTSRPTEVKLPRPKCSWGIAARIRTGLAQRGRSHRKLHSLRLGRLLGLGVVLDQLVPVAFPVFLCSLFAEQSKPLEQVGNLAFVPGLPQCLD